MDNFNLQDWFRQIDSFLGVKAKPPGRPKRLINEELLIFMHNEGQSNRSIAKELGLHNRTVDRRIIELKEKGKIQ